MKDNSKTISLSLVSHTNVGKTTLARTMLSRNVGVVKDEPHVTDSADRFVLLETPEGDVLTLWDTPGFGDSARLADRLQKSERPIGWFVTQVWDRFTDRALWSSQQAVRNAREEADVVLYLVNAAEDPDDAGYVEPEMRILQWIGKPIIVLVNQMGPPSGPADEAAEIERWRVHLSYAPAVRKVLALDAFARCWVQEDRLLGATGTLLPPEKQEEFARLREAWRARNLETFRASMKSLAEHLAQTALDREAVPERLDAAALAQRVKGWIARMRDPAPREDAALEGAMGTLTKRLDERARADTDRLIALHGLAGRAKQQILARTAGQFEVAMPADVAGTGLVGGALSGAAGGLAADLSTGGLSLGAGMIIGAILGALGGGGAARAYNVLQGQEDGRVRWSGDFLAQATRAALLRYLAVAHYGRGRGEWVEGEAPKHWTPLVDQAVSKRMPALQVAWNMAREGADAAAISARVEPEITSAAREVLTRLYPDSAAIFDKRA